MSKSTNEKIKASSGDVFEDLSFSPEEATVLRLKTSLHTEIMKVVKRRKLTGRQLEKLLDIPHSRVSELKTGKISTMTVDRLTKYLYRLGRQVNFTTQKVRTLQKEKVA